MSVQGKVRAERRALIGAVVCLVFGVLALLGSGYALGVAAPRALAEKAAFRAADPCPEPVSKPAPAPPPAPDCVHWTPAVVERTATHPGRTPRHDLTVRHAGQDTTRTFTMDGDRPVFAAVDKGDPVRLGHWRGEVRSVAAAGRQQDTRLPALREPGLRTGIGLALASPGAMLLWAAHWKRSARRSADGTVSAASDAPEIAVPSKAAVLLCVGGFLVGLAVREPWAGLAWTAAGAALLAPVVAWQLRRARRAPADATVVVRARPLDREEVFPGGVVGDVSYAGHGCDHLVAARGRLAATPDPTGVFACREVPRSLRVERVRAARRDDAEEIPDGWWVAECRDGDAPLLLACAPPHMGWVLGALGVHPDTLQGPPSTPRRGSHSP